MRRHIHIGVLAGLAALLALSSGPAAAGLEVNLEGAYPGYTLVAPMADTNTYLMDNNGEVVHVWASDYRPGQAAYLLEDGRLLRTATDRNNSVFIAGGAGGRVQMLAWDGSVTWDYAHFGDTFCSHHDAVYLPNGNVLMIVWQYKTADQAQAAGRDPGLLAQGELWPDSIVEVRPVGAEGGEVVWQWNVWDHLVQDRDPDLPNHGVVADHPELIDLNHAPGGGGADWTHINSVAYSPDLDQVLLSAHGFNEIWVIDHGTTTAQSAGHSGGRYAKGGDLLYRWGNPQAYDLGGSNHQKLFGQHDATWIDGDCPGVGDMLIFNNGQGRPAGAWSSVEQITPPLEGDGSYAREAGQAFGPAAASWSYQPDPANSMYADHISGAQRLPNGNTLICLGTSGALVEVTAQGEEVWRYVVPATGSGPAGNSVFKTRRYGVDHPGLASRDLTPQGALE